MYILLALLMLGIMVTVHELGHFCAARACGIAVRGFGIGFGPKLISWTGKKSGTEYSLRLIPCGGYCSFYGEDDTQGTTAREDPRSLTRQAAWKRLLTIAAGPMMNFVLALVVALGFYAGYGLREAGDEVYTVVVSCEADSPAAQAGLQPYDIIARVNGVEVRDRLGELLNTSGGEEIALSIQRGEEQLEVRVTPRYSEENERYMLGITMQLYADVVWRRAPFGETLVYAWNECVSAGRAVLDALKGLLTRGEGLDQMSGPVGVINIIAQETKYSKLRGYLNILIMISINLGLVNLLPIPGLDGCRIVFVLIEMIFHRPVNRQIEAYIHLAGYVLLLGLMVYFTFHDVLNIFG